MKGRLHFYTDGISPGKESAKKSKDKEIILKKSDISKLNKLIFAGAKLFSDKIVISLRKAKRNTHSVWQFRLEIKTKKLK